MKQLEQNSQFERETKETPFYSKYKQSLINPPVPPSLKGNLLDALHDLKCPHSNLLKSISVTDSFYDVLHCELDENIQKTRSFRSFSVDSFVDFVFHESENEKKTSELAHDELKSEINGIFHATLSHRKEIVEFLLKEFRLLYDELPHSPANDFMRAAKRDAFTEKGSLAIGVAQFARNLSIKEKHGASFERVSLEKVKVVLEKNKNRKTEEILSALHGFFNILVCPGSSIQIFGNIERANEAESLLKCSIAEEYTIPLDKMVQIRSEQGANFSEICQEAFVFGGFVSNSPRTKRLLMIFNEKSLHGVSSSEVEELIGSWELRELIKNIGDQTALEMEVGIGNLKIAQGLSRAFEESMLHGVSLKFE